MGKTLYEIPQVGRTSIAKDRRRLALLPGKRISSSGNIYWETRKNRSDKSGSNI